MKTVGIVSSLATLALVAAGATTASATPAPSKATTAKDSPAKQAAKRIKPGKDGAHARVAVGKDLRPAREAIGRRDEPLTPLEETARDIEKLLRGPLHMGTTGLFVADAKTGEPLFAVNADDALNPASNVKMISMATALELLGADFRYPTRVLGPSPEADGIIHGDIYLLGSHDPTLSASDFDDIAKQLADKGVRELSGNIVVGSDPTRDGIYRAIVPIQIKASAPGEAPTITTPPGYELVTIANHAKTRKGGGGAALSYKLGGDATHVTLDITGSIGNGGSTSYNLATTQRTLHAANVLRATMRSHAIAVTGEIKTAELGDFVGDAVTAGALPIELGRHDSAPLSQIVAHVNKWSINWLADRVIMTAAALSKQTSPSMKLAVDAMYSWLDRHAHIAKSAAVIDTGSGLSYNTQISPHELVSIVRSASGFSGGPVSSNDVALGHAWLDSLAVGGNDGTLSHRFRTTDVRGRLRAKTGTLSTVIALSGILDVDPSRPLAFSIVTNGDTPLPKNFVRKAHEQVIGVLCRYLSRTTKHTATAPIAAPPVVVAPAAPEPADLDESPADPVLDDETVGGSPRP